MNRAFRSAFLPIALAIGLCAGAYAVAGYTNSGPFGEWRVAPATDADAAVQAVKDANYARAVAARTFDVSGIRAHFADDPAVPLTPPEADQFQRLAPGETPRGMLTFELAHFRAWQAGAVAFQRVQSARRAGRLPDPKDVAAAIPPRVDPIRDMPMTVHKVQISGTYAYVEAETEAQYFRVTLVKRGGVWLVAGENNTPKLGPP